MRYFFLFLLFLLAPSVGAVAVMPVELDLCRSNKVYVENNLEEWAKYTVYNNEEKVFSFYLEPGKRRGVYITMEGDASIEEIAPDTQDVINSVEIRVKPCGKNYLSNAVKAASIGLAFVLVSGIALFYWIAKRKALWRNCDGSKRA